MGKINSRTRQNLLILDMNALIIDDNEMARMTLKQLAARVDDLTIVAECSSAYEAYNRLLSEPIDVLLLDVEMPGMSGLELTKNLTKKRQSSFLSLQKKNMRRMPLT